MKWMKISALFLMLLLLLQMIPIYAIAGDSSLYIMRGDIKKPMR